MCGGSKTPKTAEVDQPQVLRNPFLESRTGDTSSVAAARTGRSSLRIPLNTSDPLFNATNNAVDASAGSPTKSKGNGTLIPTYGRSDRDAAIKVRDARRAKKSAKVKESNFQKNLQVSATNSDERK